MLGVSHFDLFRRHGFDFGLEGEGDFNIAEPPDLRELQRAIDHAEIIGGLWVIRPLARSLKITPRRDIP